MKRIALSLAALFALGMSVGIAPVYAQTVAAAPALLNYQGRLANPSGNPVPDGTYSIRFSLWDALTGGTEKWNQTLANVQVKNGTFAVLLNTNTAGLFNGNLWLETKIGSDPALSPRQQLVSVAYAMKANSVPDGSIGANQIANNSITSAKLASGTLDSMTWLLGGNAITSAANQFFGTTSAQPLIFRTNNTEKMRLLANGNFGIGTPAPAAMLDVNGNAVIRGANTLEFGLGFNKEISAGKIGYQTFTADALDIVGAGTTATNRKVKVYAEGGTTFTGEITAPVMTVTGGSDVAEPYNVAATQGVKPLPGMVVCIDGAKVGQMRVASRAYDKTVAGIISGANGINPGITLRQKGTVADGELPVASIGRVWCYCDADANGAIEAGDMLTTSDTPGHAMKVNDHNQANGSVIGKAMSSLKSGKGLVLVLVSLK